MGIALGERSGLKGDAVLRGVRGRVDPAVVGTMGIGCAGAPLGFTGKGGSIPLGEVDGDGGN